MAVGLVARVEGEVVGQSCDGRPSFIEEFLFLLKQILRINRVFSCLLGRSSNGRFVGEVGSVEPSGPGCNIYDGLVPRR